MLQSFPRIATLPMDQCTVPAVAAWLKIETMCNSARVAEQQQNILSQWRVLAAKGETDRPLSETLREDDLTQWAQLGQQYDADSVAQLVESMRERDIDVLLKQVQFADAEYRSATHPKEGSPDDMAYFAMALAFAFDGSYRKLYASSTRACGEDLNIPRQCLGCTDYYNVARSVPSPRVPQQVS